MELKINLNYKRGEPKTDEEKKVRISDSALTMDYINFATKKKFPDGITTNLQLRIFARIQNKIDDAILDKKDFVSLEKAEVTFLKEVFKDDITFPSELAKYVVVLLDEVERLFSVSKEEEIEVEKKETTKEKK